MKINKSTKRFGIVLVLGLIIALVAGVVSAQPGDGANGRGNRPEEGRRGLMAMREMRELVQIVADTTGLSVQDVAEQVRSGSSLADVITANGGNVDDVKAQAITKATDQINQALENKRITQEQADKLLENLDTVITEMLNRNPAEVQEVRMVVMRVAGETGLLPRDVIAQWQAGSTLSQLLTDNNEDVQAFIDETVKRAEELAAKAVENGRLTQEQADARLAALRENLPTILDEAFPEGMLPILEQRAETKGV